jgi:hypothetical protein
LHSKKRRRHFHVLCEDGSILLDSHSLYILINHHASEQSKMEEKGTKIRIVSKHGYSYASMLSVEVVQDNLRISWRSIPEKLGVDMMHLKEIVQSNISNCCLHLLFQGQLQSDYS